MASIWGITERRIRLMCQEGRVDGAVKLGWSWSIPVDTPKPFDGRQMRPMASRATRLGSIDISALNRARDLCPLMDKLYTNSKVDSLFCSLVRLGFLIDGRQITDEEILSVMHQTLPRQLSYADVLKISSFRSILLRSVDAGHPWSAKGLLALHASFTQGWDDRNGRSFREGYIGEGEQSDRMKVSVQMESFMMQFERQWKGVHPVFKAALLLDGLTRLQPFDSDNGLFALLAISALLLSEGFLPPLLGTDDLNELNADLALSRSRGNFEDLARLFERSILSSCSTLFQV